MGAAGPGHGVVVAIVVVTREALTKLVALSPTYAVFLEGMFSETHIQFCESLFNRTGAMGRFAARQAANTTQFVAALDRYAPPKQGRRGTVGRSEPGGRRGARAAGRAEVYPTQ